MYAEQTKDGKTRISTLALMPLSEKMRPDDEAN
jgi:hypothetical protein